MIGILILAAFGASVLLGMHWLAEVVLDDDRDQAVTPEASQSGTPGTDAGAFASVRPYGSPDWLPSTLPALPAVALPWRPRVCAGRAAFLQAVTTVCEPLSHDQWAELSGHVNAL